MKSGALLGLLALSLVACGGDDASTPEISQRTASSAECSAGGTVLVVDGRDAATVCNGANGSDGAPGSQGLTGEAGEPGARGPTGATGSGVVSTSEIVAGVVAKAAAIVIVECTDGKGYGTGSGTKTSVGTVLTAQHVVDELPDCSIYSESPLVLLGTATAYSQRAGRDQVELTVDWTAAGASIEGVPRQLSRVPSIGDFITVVGHPAVYDGLALEHQYTTGLVTATNLRATFETVPELAGMAASWARGWSTDAVVWHGNSGGPVFDANGDWIGILVGGFNADRHNDGPDLSVVLPLF
ncbi:MAG: trypsin-like peptidase domain-containing protein [Deltaproteobacteria bacterium]